VGYYSRLELVDLRGLTDRRIGRMKLKKRRKPGHEKWPRQRYLDRRDVQIIRADRYHPKRWRHTTEVDIGARKRKRQWHFYQYDAELADQLEKLAPEIRFTRIEPAIDSWLTGSPLRPRELLEEDVAFFHHYYFECNDDPVRQELVEEVLRRSRGETVDGDRVAASQPGDLLSGVRGPRIAGPALRHTLPR